MHDHVVFHMQGGATVTYNDPRRFGFMLLIPSNELDAHPLLHHLGIEPLSAKLTAEYLAARARGKKVAAEAISLRPAHHRRARQHLRVRGAVSGPAVAVARRGDDRDQDRQAERARAGSGAGDPRRAGGCHPRRRLIVARLSPCQRRARRLQNAFCVYGREGKPCLRKGCGGTVRRIVQAGRSTFYCPALPALGDRAAAPRGAPVGQQRDERDGADDRCIRQRRYGWPPSPSCRR